MVPNAMYKHASTCSSRPMLFCNHDIKTLPTKMFSLDTKNKKNSKPVHRTYTRNMAPNAMYKHRSKFSGRRILRLSDGSPACPDSETIMIPAPVGNDAALRNVCWCAPVPETCAESGSNRSAPTTTAVSRRLDETPEMAMPVRREKPRTQMDGRTAARLPRITECLRGQIDTCHSQKHRDSNTLERRGLEKVCTQMEGRTAARPRDDRGVPARRK